MSSSSSSSPSAPSPPSFPSPTTAPDRAALRATTNLQLGSSFFGKLPLEIREMIYSEFWIVSGLKQHVFRREDGRLTHCPCLLVDDRGHSHDDGRSHDDDDDDEDKNDDSEFAEVWQNRRRSRTGSMVIVDDKWASRFSSTWNDHWRCEEEMLLAYDDTPTQGRPRLTLFLPALLTCKRIYLEALQSLYVSTTLVFTDFATAHHTLVASPTSTVPLIRSLQFSLVIPYDTLHQHHYYHTNTNPKTSLSPSPSPSPSPTLYSFPLPLPSPLPGPGPWAELCTTLSNLVRFDGLRRVILRLDLADNRYWWEVRERWVFSAVRGMLARRLIVQLPEIEMTTTATTMAATATAGSSAATGGGGGGEEDWLGPYQYRKGDKTPFFKLERYPRLRWTGVGIRGGVGVRTMDDNNRQRVNVSRSRLEFLRPADRQIIVRDMKETRLGKAKKGLKELVLGFKGI